MSIKVIVQSAVLHCTAQNGVAEITPLMFFTGNLLNHVIYHAFLVLIFNFGLDFMKKLQH